MRGLAFLWTLVAARSKVELCELDHDRAQAALRLVNVSTEMSSYPKILCIVNTISPHHATLVQAIRRTWGTKCDGLFFGSNVTDEMYGTVRIDAPSDHNHLWQKHKGTLRHVWTHYGAEYDWFFKCDDDAFVIMENLKLYLRSPELMRRMHMEPVQVGHRFKLTEDLIDYYIVDKALRQEFRDRVGQWIFNSGGPGYAMNRLYMKRIMEILDTRHCLNDKYSEMLPDDAAISFCMAWDDIFPLDTRDIHRKERFHADQPSGRYYSRPMGPQYWYVQYHDGIGGYQSGLDCCSNETIAFHYIQENNMYYAARELYYCRSAIDNLQEFNRQSGMLLPDTVFPPTPKKKRPDGSR